MLMVTKNSEAITVEKNEVIHVLTQLVHALPAGLASVTQGHFPIGQMAVNQGHRDPLTLHKSQSPVKLINYITVCQLSQSTWGASFSFSG